jgi:hypothetical protein
VTLIVPDGALHIPIWSDDPRLKRGILHDPASRDYELDTAGLEIVDVEWPSHLPGPLDQGAVGKCTTEAAANDLASDPLWVTLPADVQQALLTDPGAWTDAFYNDEENLDGDGPYPPNDNGSYGLTSAKVAQARGLIDEYRHTFSADAALKGLQLYPASWGTLWKTGMDDVNEDTGQIRYTGNTRGGHQMNLFKVDAAAEKVWGRQSWGAWGYQRLGVYWISFDDFAASLHDRGDVTFFIPKPAASTPTPTV